MDQVRLLFLLFLSITMIACGRSKSPQTVLSSAECPSAQFIDEQFIVDWEDGSRTVEHGKDVDSFLEEFVTPNLENIKNVEQDQVLEVNVQIKPQNLAVPMNPAIDNWGIERTNAPAAWQAGLRGDGVIVAVVDTGIDPLHSSLANQIAYNDGEIPDNGIDDDGNGFIDDYYGYDFLNKRALTGDNGIHGTHVAGIIAAEHSDITHNTGYVQGIAPGAKILPVAFMAQNGGSLSDALLAMDYAVMRGAQVINASWGGAPCSQSLGDKIGEIGSKGVLFVVASGNSSRNVDLFKEYPASYNFPSQITVGSIGHFNGMAAHSNYGSSLVNIFSPGVDIFSTLPDNSVNALTGTSMATPFVAGAAALLWSAQPTATATQIKAAILGGVVKDPNYINSSQGRLDMSGALSSL